VICHQPQDRQVPRAHDSGVAPPAGGSGDRVTQRTQAARPLRGVSLREVLLAFLVSLPLVGVLQGCSTSSVQQEAITQAWADRDAERAAECRRVGGFLVAGSCLPRR
jgi:hypothetical protein